MQELSTLDYAVESDIAVITFSRTGTMNTFTPEVIAELLALFDRTDADDAVRAVIVTGSGRAFCAGADLGAGGVTFACGSGARPH
jgi:enoyl-CoA hydratase/carnithine racemase